MHLIIVVSSVVALVFNISSHALFVFNYLVVILTIIIIDMVNSPQNRSVPTL